MSRIMVNNKFESIMEINRRALGELSQHSPGDTDDTQGNFQS
jgi:hypothetical protein